jgi:hypothetical protein
MVPFLFAANLKRRLAEPFHVSMLIKYIGILSAVSYVRAITPSNAPNFEDFNDSNFFMSIDGFKAALPLNK